MMIWLLAALAGALAAGVQYGRRALTARTLPVALLRAIAAMLIVALLFRAPAGSAATLAPDVALDASESWTRATDSSAWHAARDSAARSGGALRRFGDSLRVGTAKDAPTDHASRLRGVVDAATGSGRPVILVTDGELDEPELLAGLPRGSRTIVVAKKELSDAAVAALDAPHALLAGDTVQASVTVVAGAAGSGAGRLDLRLDNAVLDSAVVAALAPYAERVIVLHGVAAGAERGAVLRAVLHVAGDQEPRNDTLSLGVDVTRAPAAVFVSTAPDYDAREAVAALRGVTSLPTRAFYRVAPGMWRTDGTLARVEESVVREAVRDAPIAVLHGDTAVFGQPRAASRGALLLFAPPLAEDGEWFASAAPVSPLAPMLAGVAFDSLPPLSVSAALPRAEWQGLVTRRGGSADDRRAAVVGWETPRRIAIIGASGFWRWRFRRGVRADAYSALFGALYDWLAAGRTDRRAVVPDVEPLRAGMPVRWRRGAPADSVATATIERREGTAQRRTLSVRFSEGSAVAETPALPPGIYEVTTSGGNAVLAVNQSREFIPRRPTVTSSAVGGEAAVGDVPAVTDWAWVYALVVLLLCAEWLLRRRVGLR
ncbi:MAG: hypothetical protein JWM95_1658 [Gemmatimonadetes bacterium]|nr:hypothetical protein [Gemmatimonadota bacterium]